MNRKKYISYLREKANKHAFYRGSNTPCIDGEPDGPYRIVTDGIRRRAAALLEYWSYNNGWKHHKFDTYLMIESSGEAYEAFVRNGHYPVFDKRRRKRMERHYGKPCGRYYHPNCVSCAGWGMFFFYGKFPSSSRVLNYISSLGETAPIYSDSDEIDLAMFSNCEE